MTLTTLSFTDIEDRPDKLMVLEDFLKSHDQVNVAFSTGDHIKSNPLTTDATAYKIKERIEKETQVPEIKTIDERVKVIIEKYQAEGKITKREEEEYHSLNRQKVNILTDRLRGDILGTVFKSYDALEEVYSKIAQIVPLFGVLGNNDLTIGYDRLVALYFWKKARQ
jgi:hypothetical protein